VAELARGTVLDRPWGRTLAALGLRGLTGQLTVIGDGAKLYQIAFHEGTVVAAASPLASDAAVRIAMTLGLVSSTVATELARKQTAQPAGALDDDVAQVAEAAKLPPDPTMRLRRRAIAQRAARTFSVESGDFVVEDRMTLPIVAGAAVDIRTVVYLGAKALVSAARLDRELAQLGAWFQLKPEAREDLRQFGFGEAERPVLEQLGAGAGLAELEAGGVDQRIVRAVVYALVSCNACNVEMAARASGARPAAPVASRAEAAGASPTPPLTRVPAASTAMPRPGASPAAPGSRSPGAPAAAATSAARAGGPVPSPVSKSRAVELDAPTLRRDVDPATIVRRDPPMAPPPAASSIDAPTARGHKKSRPPASRANEPAALEVEALIKTRLAVLDAGSDHFELLGVPRDASIAQIRSAYLTLARNLHPDRLQALGVSDEERRAQRLFAEVNAAFALLSDGKRRDEYVALLARGGEAAIRAEQARAEEMTQRVLDSEEAFRKGEQALRRDQIAVAIRELEHAVSLNPDEADYQAALAWARFAGTPDKSAIAAATRSTLERAIQRSPRSAPARFYLGRVERMLGREQDAIRHFQEVLRLSPNHADAASELRVLESRQAEKDKGGSGLFGRLKR